MGKAEEQWIDAKREESSFSHRNSTECSHLDSSVRKGASHTLSNKGIQKKKRDAVTPKKRVVWCGRVGSVDMPGKKKVVAFFVAGNRRWNRGSNSSFSGEGGEERRCMTFTFENV